MATLAGGDRAVGHRSLPARVDTLEATIKEVKRHGRQKLVCLGGHDRAAIEGEYRAVHSAAGSAGAATATGTIRTTNASFHVHAQALVDPERDGDTWVVRPDAAGRTADEVRALAIADDGFVGLDPRTVLSEDGLLESRRLLGGTPPSPLPRGDGAAAAHVSRVRAGALTA